MKKLIVFADLHKNSPGGHAWNGRLEYGENVIYAGDVMEFKNLAKNRVPKCILEYKSFLNMCKLTKTVVVAGNHETSVGRDYCSQYAMVKTFNGKRILVIHGDVLYWNHQKVKKWRNRKPGVSWFKLQLIKLKNGNYKESKPKRPSIEVLDEAVRLARANKCTHLVYGHTHNYFRGLHHGIDIINVGRGRTVIKI